MSNGEYLHMVGGHVCQQSCCENSAPQKKKRENTLYTCLLYNFYEQLASLFAETLSIQLPSAHYFLFLYFKHTEGKKYAFTIQVQIEIFLFGHTSFTHLSRPSGELQVRQDIPHHNEKLHAEQMTSDSIWAFIVVFSQLLSQWYQNVWV